jgi:hypothetical protein
MVACPGLGLSLHMSTHCTKQQLHTTVQKKVGHLGVFIPPSLAAAPCPNSM